ncbi:MAG: hypothetical protein INR62_14245 [Rhodospirillales bacterium]|nr:hypothetical protein [Acetobacter sp.]
MAVVPRYDIHNPMRYHTYSSSAGLYPTRIKRTSFLFRGLTLLSGGFLASLLISSAHHAGILAQIVCIGGGVSALLLLFAAMFSWVLIPRLRDIGVHPAWSLLIFFHALSGLFLLALLLIPSDAFVNRRYNL